MVNKMSGRNHTKMGSEDWNDVNKLRGKESDVNHAMGSEFYFKTIERKKIANEEKYANFKGEFRFPCEIQL